MAILTLLSLEDARALGTLYGLVVTDVRGIRAGSVNSNFEIVCGAERFFLRIYEEQTKVTARREAALLSHLARLGVPTPEPLMRLDGSGFVSETAHKPVAIFPFCHGDMVCQNSVTEEHARSMGGALRSIHEAGRTIAESTLAELSGEERFGRDALLNRLVHVARVEPNQEIASTCQKLQRFLETLAPSPRAIGLIHGDVFRDNVLWQGPTISAVLDFESASLGSLAFDLMVTVLAWCFGDDLDPRLAKAMIDGYRGAQPLSGDITADLYDAGRFACVRFVTTRLTDFELRPRSVTVYKDYRRWKQRLECLEKLEAEGLARLLGI